MHSGLGDHRLTLDPGISRPVAVTEVNQARKMPENTSDLRTALCPATSWTRLPKRPTCVPNGLSLPTYPALYREDKTVACSPLLVWSGRRMGPDQRNATRISILAGHVVMRFYSTADP